jgi:hypothetical protein
MRERQNKHRVRSILLAASILLLGSLAVKLHLDEHDVIRGTSLLGKVSMAASASTPPSVLDKLARYGLTTLDEQSSSVPHNYYIWNNYLPAPFKRGFTPVNKVLGVWSEQAAKYYA